MESVFYTICPAPDPAKTILHLTQLKASIDSLRRVNFHIPIYIFTFGIPARAIETTLKQLGVRIIEKPLYNSALEPYCGGRTAAFSHYPVLHRWLVLEDFRKSSEDTLLYVDCDTYFAADPAILFTAAGDRDWHTREEPYSSHSYLGYDPNYINEKALQLLACQVSSSFLPPINIGVMLMKNRVWERVQLVLDCFFTYMWAFLIWMAYYGQDKIMADKRMQPILHEIARVASLEDRRNALPFPSSNGWIVDELAILLALGRIEPFSWGFFDREQVLQGIEFTSLNPHTLKFSDAVLCHYFSKNHVEFMRWRESAIAGQV
jgi:hypothetical protein